MAQQDHDRRIDYIELPVDDVGVAKAFYGAVFGWKFTDYGPDYASFEDGRLAGGFEGGRTGMRGGALVVIYAAALEAVRGWTFAPATACGRPVAATFTARITFRL